MPANPLLQPPLPAPATPGPPSPPAVLHPAPASPPPAVAKPFSLGPGPKAPAAPAAPTPPAPPAPGSAATTQQAAPWLTKLGPGPGGLLGQAQQWADRNKYDLTAAATTKTPPLVASGLTSRLPDAIREPAESFLGFAQRGLQGNPQMTAGLAGGLAPGIVGPLLGSGVGLPALAGLHGLLAGGESAAAAKTLFDPLTRRLGL